MSAVRINGWPVHFAGNTVRFSSDHAGILETLKTHFKYCIGEDGPVVASYKITALNETDFSVSANNADLFSKFKYDQVLWYLMQDSTSRLNGAAKAGLVFHAAALSHLDTGLILCGGAGTGKSSLSAWLLANGLQYLTDEVIVFPVNGGEIGGFCRSITLKSGSSFIWQRWLRNTEADGFHRFEDGRVWITPTLFNPDAVRTRVTPRILFFPHYSPEKDLSVQLLTPASALFHLLQCLVNARNFSDGGLAATTQLAKQVTAYTLTYSDIESAALWIKQAVQAG